jgi:hypothetical protein
VFLFETAHVIVLFTTQGLSSDAKFQSELVSNTFRFWHKQLVEHKMTPQESQKMAVALYKKLCSFSKDSFAQEKEILRRLWKLSE